MHHEKIIKVPLYPVRLGIMLTDDQKKMQAYFVKNKDYQNAYENVEPYGTTHETNHNGYTVIMIALNPNDELYKRSFVAHESSHACDRLFKMIGCPEQIGEPRAYLIEWIAEEIYKFADKHKIKV